MSKELINNEESIVEYLEDLSSGELVEKWNTYCLNEHKENRMIYENDADFFDLKFDDKPFEAVKAVKSGRYSTSHKYVAFNEQNNLESFDDSAEYFDLYELANYIQQAESYYPDIMLVERYEWFE